MKIVPENFLEIIKRSYSLDIIYLLQLVKQEYDLSILCKESAKLEAIYQTMLRKDLITSDGKITMVGEELLNVINSDVSVKFIKPKPKSEEFDEFWKVYPATDTFVANGRTFTGSRSLRTGKEACRAKFDKILLEGEHTAAQIIQALQYDVKQKIERSLKTGENKLSYMQNSLTYLNQRSYEAFMELIKSVPENYSSSSSTDI